MRGAASVIILENESEDSCIRSAGNGINRYNSDYVRLGGSIQDVP